MPAFHDVIRIFEFFCNNPYLGGRGVVYELEFNPNNPICTFNEAYKYSELRISRKINNNAFTMDHPP